MPKITIDGKEIEFKPGQTVIQAATQAGIEIPHFCWHPSLSVSGNCRMCLVEIEKMPKLAIACSTLAADSMVVKVNSEAAIKARNAVMEFILINHPLDCPICDEAGECNLQDYTFKYSVGESRFTEEKQHNNKRVPLGPRVTFDAERCISCSRCVRFCKEIAKENQLTFTKRGDSVTLAAFPDKSMDNPYSLNTTDICPVGALTNTDFRFKSRVWEMSKTNSVCVGCSRGCNTEVWVRNDEVMRLTPRFNQAVNSYWMCDEGRLNTFKNVNSDKRIDGPHLRRDGKLIKVGWDECVAKAAFELKQYNAKEIAFLGSAHASCEDNYMLAKFARTIIGSHNIDYAKYVKPGSGDDILITEDKAPNTLGAELSGVKPSANGLGFDAIFKAIESRAIKALVILEDDIASLKPEYSAALSKLDLLIITAGIFNSTTDIAHIVFPAASYAEKNGVFVNFQGRVQRITPAVSTVDLDRSLTQMAQSRLDKFGTEYDRWGKSPKRDARSSWRPLASIAVLMGVKIKYHMTEEVFEELAGKIPAFDGMDYESIGQLGLMIKGRS
jgi:NADH-quinone oxidoreductase subunit G